MSKDSPRILIAASGSGGHLFPALFIAEALKELKSNAVIEFVGSGRPLEESLIVARGFKRHIVAIKGVKNRGILGLIDFVIRLPRAVCSTFLILRTLKPDVIIGVGGYASVLPVVCGRILKIPAWIHEAEIYPGSANRCLAIFANKISVAFSEARMPFRSKVEYTGHPLRKELIGLNMPRPKTSKPNRLLVMGGSQGAAALDLVLPKLAQLLKSQAVEVQHQARAENVTSIQNAYLAAGVNAKVVPFISDLRSAYEWCDIIVTRSGAGTVMEVSVVGKPVLFVPYPHAQGGHQLKNAQWLETRGKAIVVEEGAGFEDRLRSALEKLLNIECYNQMLQRPLAERLTNGAQRIAAGVLGLI